MSRSLKKGPFIDPKLEAKIVAQGEGNKKSVIKTWSRASMISPDFVGQTIAVHMAVALPDTAVVAIILANVRKLDKSSYIYPVAKPLVSQIVSFPSEILKVSEIILRALRVL